MKNSVIMFALSACLMAPVAAQDGKFQAELVKVENRYNEVLTSLREKAVAGGDKQTVSKIDAILAAQPKSAPSPAADANPLLPPVESQWEGTSSRSGEADQKVDANVTQSAGDTFTIRTLMDRGAIWEWKFKMDEGGNLKLEDFERLRKQQGIRKPVGTGEVRATGHLRNGKLSWNFSWPTDKDTLRGSFDLTPKKKE